MSSGMSLDDALIALRNAGGSIRLIDGQPRLIASERLSGVVMEALQEHRNEIVEGLHMADQNPFVGAAMKAFGAVNVRALSDEEYRRLFARPNFNQQSQTNTIRRATTEAAAQPGGDKQ